MFDDYDDDAPMMRCPECEDGIADDGEPCELCGGTGEIPDLGDAG